MPSVTIFVIFDRIRLSSPLKAFPLPLFIPLSLSVFLSLSPNVSTTSSSAATSFSHNNNDQITNSNMSAAKQAAETERKTRSKTTAAAKAAAKTTAAAKAAAAKAAAARAASAAARAAAAAAAVAVKEEPSCKAEQLDDVNAGASPEHKKADVESRKRKRESEDDDVTCAKFDVEKIDALTYMQGLGDTLVREISAARGLGERGMDVGMQYVLQNVALASIRAQSAWIPFEVLDDISTLSSVDAVQAESKAAIRLALKKRYVFGAMQYVSVQGAHWFLVVLMSPGIADDHRRILVFDSAPWIVPESRRRSMIKSLRSQLGAQYNEEQQQQQQQEPLSFDDKTLPAFFVGAKDDGRGGITSTIAMQKRGSRLCGMYVMAFAWQFCLAHYTDGRGEWKERFFPAVVDERVWQLRSDFLTACTVNMERRQLNTGSDACILSYVHQVCLALRRFWSEMAAQTVKGGRPSVLSWKRFQVAYRSLENAAPGLTRLYNVFTEIRRSDPAASDTSAMQSAVRNTVGCPLGIKNSTANMCFLAAPLQLLRSIPVFEAAVCNADVVGNVADIIRSLNADELSRDRKLVMSCIVFLFRALRAREQDSANDLAEALAKWIGRKLNNGAGGSGQQDAHEALASVLLSEEGFFPPAAWELIDHLAYERIYCKHCDKVLSHATNEHGESHRVLVVTRQKDLYACGSNTMDGGFNVSDVDKECPKAKSDDKSHTLLQSTVFDTAPKVLIVMVRRSKFSQLNAAAQSDEERMEMPTVLDLGQFSPQSASAFRPLDRMYDLHGFVQHIGGASAGHFFAYSLVGDQPWKFDDCRVSLYSQRDFDEKQHKSYLYAYVQRSSATAAASVVGDAAALNPPAVAAAESALPPLDATAQSVLDALETALRTSILERCRTVASAHSLLMSTLDVRGSQLFQSIEEIAREHLAAETEKARRVQIDQQPSLKQEVKKCAAGGEKELPQGKAHENNPQQQK